MNKEDLRFLIRTLGAAVICMALATGVYAYPSGAPAGYTGSPGDGHHCTSCHGGSSATVSGWITSNIPASGYTAGAAYTMTVTVTGTGNKGFEVSPQNASGTQLGTLAAGTGNHITGGTKYVTQSSQGSYSSTATWSFTWTAPAAGTGSVTFYGAFCVGKTNTKLSTLVVSENAVVPLGVTASANPSTITLGQTSQLNAVATGGTGTYTYSWISNPAGFTSTQQNPMVSPTATTQYTVTVSDGSGTAQGSTTVTVNAIPLAATATATPSTICEGQSSQLGVSPSGGTGNYTYSWTSLPAGFTSTLPNPTVTPAVTTQYLVQVSDGVNAVNASATVTVNLPATAAAGNDTAVGYVATAIQLNGIATNYASVLWTTSGTGSFSAANALAGTYTFSASDKAAFGVTLTLTAVPQAPCTTTAADSRTITIGSPTGMAENNPGMAVSVSPNPAHGQVTICTKSDALASITITDLYGQTVLTGSDTPIQRFDLTGIAKGVYLVRVKSGPETATRKLVIE